MDTVANNYKRQLVTITWLALFLYDISLGLPVYFNHVIPILFTATGICAYFMPDIRPITLLQKIAWAPIIGWLIFITIGLSTSFISPILPQYPLYVIEPYISIVGIINIGFVSILFSLFGIALFNNNAIYVNLAASLLTSSLIIFVVGGVKAIFISESSVLVICLLVLTYVIQRLTRRSTRKALPCLDRA